LFKSLSEEKSLLKLLRKKIQSADVPKLNMTMESREVGFLLLTFILCTQLNRVSSIKCVVCDSSVDPLCTEFYTYSSPAAPTSCNTTYDAKYCVKTTGVFGGKVGTQRFCSSRDMYNQCRDIMFADHERVYRACVYTCSNEDGCNGSSVPSLSGTILLAVGLVVWRTLSLS